MAEKAITSTQLDQALASAMSVISAVTNAVTISVSRFYSSFGVEELPRVMTKVCSADNRNECSAYVTIPLDRMGVDIKMEDDNITSVLFPKQSVHVVLRDVVVDCSQCGTTQLYSSGKIKVVSVRRVDTDVSIPLIVPFRYHCANDIENDIKVAKARLAGADVYVKVRSHPVPPDIDKVIPVHTSQFMFYELCDVPGKINYTIKLPTTGRHFSVRASGIKGFRFSNVEMADSLSVRIPLFGSQSYVVFQVILASARFTSNQRTIFAVERPNMFEHRPAALVAGAYKQWVDKNINKQTGKHATCKGYMGDCECAYW